MYFVVAYCFTRTSLKSTLDALLALVNLKHALPSGAHQTESCSIVCMWNILWVRKLPDTIFGAYALALSLRFSFDLQLRLLVVFCVCWYVSRSLTDAYAANLLLLPFLFILPKAFTFSLWFSVPPFIAQLPDRCKI